MEKVTDIQKAGIWKRISAFLFDMILMSILTVLFALLFSGISDYSGKLQRHEEIRDEVAETYGPELTVTEEQYNALDKDAQEALYALSVEYNRLTELLLNLALLFITFAFLLAYLILELIIPLIFKNGQTLGKKIFGICLMRNDCVKVSGPLLFIRTVLGKFAVETMIPVYFAILVLFGQGNVLSVLLLVIVPIVNLILIIATKNNCPLHDLLAQTLVVDFASQRIFDTREALVAYKTAQHEMEVAALREENVFQKH